MIDLTQSIGRHYMSYSRLKVLTAEAFSTSDSDTLNVYIDMYSIVYYLFKDIRENIENYTNITSSIVNMCAHIRAYYMNYHRVKTKIFIVYSNNIPEAALKYFPDYNYVFRSMLGSNTIVRNLVADNIDLLGILCPYLPDVFFIQDTFEVGVVINDLINKQEALGDTSPSLIFSKDAYMYQLAGVRDNVAIFRCRKSSLDGNDYSWFVDHNNLYERHRKYAKMTNPDRNILNSTLYSMVLAMSNLPARCIKSCYTFDKACSIVEEAVLNGRINNIYTGDIRYALENMTFDKHKSSILDIENRFRAIDIIYQSGIYINTPNCHSNMDTVVNLYDPDSIRAINNEYFKNNPLDLNRL